MKVIESITVACAKHPDEQMLPVYSYGADGESVLECYACVKCMAGEPFRIPMEFAK